MQSLRNEGAVGLLFRLERRLRALRGLLFLWPVDFGESAEALVVDDCSDRCLMCGGADRGSIFEAI